MVGVPVIIAEAIFSTLPVSILDHFLLASLGGYAVSLVFVYLSLKFLRLERRSKVNEGKLLGAAMADTSK